MREFDETRRGSNIEFGSLGKSKIALEGQKLLDLFIEQYGVKEFDEHEKPFFKISKKYLNDGIKLFLQLINTGYVEYKIKKTPKTLLELLMKKAGDFPLGTQENNLYDYKISFFSTIDTPVDLMGVDGIVVVSSVDSKDVRVVAIDATGNPLKLSGKKFNNLAYVYDATLDPEIDKDKFTNEMDRLAGVVLKDVVSKDVRRFSF